MSQLTRPRNGSPISIVKFADGMSFIGVIIIFCAVLWFVSSINHTVAPSQSDHHAMQRELSCLWDASGTFSIAPSLDWRCDSIGYSTLPLWLGIAGVIGGGLLRCAQVNGIGNKLMDRVPRGVGQPLGRRRSRVRTGDVIRQPHQRGMLRLRVR